ncbi:hypothetical protein [Halegenticoccus soli]|uniref:hypothetical protein n=1 Tax=Halegenticoccus soli TaxID=1985678 RepID=UPI000C6E4E3B|nr:hypothetical protein [Halegenticoccus soli]
MSRRVALRWRAGREALVRIAGAAGAFAPLTGVVSAHGNPATGSGPAVSAGFAVALCAAASLAGGLLVARRVENRGATPRALGALLFALGFLAAALALGEDLGAASVGTAAGIGLAAAGIRGRKTSGSACGGCADATFAAVALHRAVEGALLAAVAATGAAVGVVAALVLAGHATVETAAVGGVYAADGGRRAIAAVIGVQAAFVAGAAAGGLAVAALPPSVRVAALGLSGGLLTTAGVLAARRPAPVGEIDVAARA